MKNVIDFNQFRPKSTSTISTGQLASILDKALGCLEPDFELGILSTLLRKCTQVLGTDGSTVNKDTVLEEAKYSLYSFTFAGNVLLIEFESGPSFVLKSVFFIDPKLSKEISIALELETKLNTGKRKRAALSLQEASFID